MLILLIHFLSISHKLTSCIIRLILHTHTHTQIKMAMAYKNGLPFISRHKKPTICTVQYWLSKQGIIFPMSVRTTYHTVMKLFITPWGHTLDNKEANISQIVCRISIVYLLWMKTNQNNNHFCMHTPRQSSVQQSSQQRKLTARYSKCSELLYLRQHSVNC